MKDLLQRSISSYHSSQHTNMPLFTRHVSVPCDIYRQDVYNEEAGSSPRQTALSATVSHQVMACVEDAAASISKVCTTILHHPESITPDFSPEHFQPLLRDAEILEPGIAYLVTKKKPDALSVVKDILSKMQQEYPHLEPQYLSSAIKAVENASILLHLPRSSNVNVQVTQPRAIIAVTMIVNKYLNNLTHSNFK